MAAGSAVNPLASQAQAAQIMQAIQRAQALQRAPAPAAQAAPGVDPRRFVVPGLNLAFAGAKAAPAVSNFLTGGAAASDVIPGVGPLSAAAGFEGEAGALAADSALSSAAGFTGEAGGALSALGPLSTAAGAAGVLLPAILPMIEFALFGNDRIDAKRAKSKASAQDEQARMGRATPQATQAEQAFNAVQPSTLPTAAPPSLPELASLSNFYKRFYAPGTPIDPDVLLQAAKNLQRQQQGQPTAGVAAEPVSAWDLVNAINGGNLPFAVPPDYYSSIDQGGGSL